jgi:DNA-binding response OmpR family regulator
MTQGSEGLSAAAIRVLLVGDGFGRWPGLMEVLIRRQVQAASSPNGRAAAQMAAAHHFDLVFIDPVHLPDFEPMDVVPDAPVVAVLPADSLLERRVARDAGADVCLAEPVDPGEIDAWLTRAAARTPAGPPSDQPPILDVDDLLERTAGRARLVDKMAAGFHESAKTFIDRPEELARRPLPEIRRAVHSLGGAAAHLGLKRLSGKAREVQRYADLDMAPEALAALAQLTPIVERSLARLEAYLVERPNLPD